MPPVAVGATPATGENSEKELSHPCGCPVAQRRQIRNQTGVPKQDRDGEIGRNGKHIPHQRAAEILPDRPVARNGREIPCHPEPADVDAGKNRCTNHRKKRHRFGRAVDRSAPFLPQQKEDGGDQRARVSDPDPENEVGDPPSPSDRDVVSPCAHAGGNQVSNAKKSKGRGASSDRERHPPPARRGLLHHTRNALGQPTKIAPVQNKRYAGDLPLRLFNRFRRCWGCVHVQIANCRLRKICKRRGRRAGKLSRLTVCNLQSGNFILQSWLSESANRCFLRALFEDSRHSHSK